MIIEVESCHECLFCEFVEKVMWGGIFRCKLANEVFDCGDRPHYFETNCPLRNEEITIRLKK